MKRLSVAALALFAACSAQAEQPHNVILFVPDGLRSEMVTPANAPAMAQLAHDGVYFANSHSLFPTFTTANASGLSTGHYLGDTGDFSNTIYVGFPVPGAHESVTPFIENDTVLGDLDKHFGGNYLDEITVLEQAANQGYNTAAVGKLGPTLIFSHTKRDGKETVVIDDRTGRADGVPLPSWLAEAMTMNDITVATPSRGDNSAEGTLVANTQQLTYFTKVITKLLLPKFKQDGKPFLVVFWSRDPDGSQHNQGDSPDALVPGINGPTSLAAIRNADDQVGKLRQTLAELGLDRTTDIIVSADHGFSTLSRVADSLAAKERYDDVPIGFLPPGFVALDLAAALGMPLSDPDSGNAKVTPGHHPKGGNGLLGKDPTNPELVVAANGGSDLIYIPAGPSARYQAGRAINFLLHQDYVSGIFVDPALGEFPGTLPLSDINLVGHAVTPQPSILVNFRSFSTGCDKPTTCSVDISDTTLNHGQGMHGSFSRGDTFNFTAAIGPDFKAGYKDQIPVSNADVGETIAALLQLNLPKNGTLVGRPMAEAFPGGAEPKVESVVLKSKPGPDGQTTILKMQKVGETKYFDTAGFKGRTLGLD
jgi:arylsulfatase A-like enzyme